MKTIWTKSLYFQ